MPRKTNTTSTTPEIKEFSFKPNKSAYLYYPFAISCVVWAVILIVVSLVASHFIPLFWMGAGLLYVVSAILVFMLRSVRYRKEEYYFYTDRIVQKGGSLFSDYQTELLVRNITHCKVVLPFLENKFFATGSVNILSAGSGSTQIFMTSVDAAQRLYKYLPHLLQANGFKLTRNKIIQQESPDPLGVLFEVGRTFIASLVSLFFMFIWIGAGVATLVAGYLRTQMVLLILLGVMIFFAVIMWNIFYYMDLVRRKYVVYSDAITYTEGFLSKHYAFMPIENLSDSETKQTLVDRMFGLYDVTISCQGSGQEITFKNMRNGKKLEKNVDALISQTTSLAGSDSAAKSRSKSVSSTSSKTVNAVKKSAKKQSGVKLPSSKYTAQFKMHFWRAVFAVLVAFPFCLIFFVLLPYWFVLAFTVGSRAVATTFHVKANSVEEKYKLFNTKNKEFSNDKVTSVVVKENFIDKWFGTVTIQFKSIGSHGVVSFSHIKKTKDLLPKLLEKFGITNQDVLYETKPDFSLRQAFSAHLLTSIVFIVVLPLLFVVGVFVPFVLVLPVLMILIMGFNLFYFSKYYDLAQLLFFEGFVFFKKGWLFKESHYARYENIKDISIVKYPFSDHGSIRFNIAGEVMVQQGKNQVLMSSGFSVPYITQIQDKDEFVDLIFHQRPSAKEAQKIEQNIAQYKETPLAFVKPALANSLVPSMIFFGFVGLALIVGSALISVASLVFVLPLYLVIVGLIIVLTIVHVKAKSYAIESYRVVAKSGILYKKQKSIIFDKIDFLNMYEGMFNKMFKNGNITINTAGSKRPEIVIANVPGYKDFYQKLREISE